MQCHLEGVLVDGFSVFPSLVRPLVGEIEIGTIHSIGESCCRGILPNGLSRSWLQILQIDGHLREVWTERLKSTFFATSG